MWWEETLIRFLGSTFCPVLHSQYFTALAGVFQRSETFARTLHFSSRK